MFLYGSLILGKGSKVQTAGGFVSYMDRYEGVARALVCVPAIRIPSNTSRPRAGAKCGSIAPDAASNAERPRPLALKSARYDSVRTDGPFRVRQ